MRRTSRAGRRTAGVLLSLSVCSAGPALAQVPAECATAECARGAVQPLPPSLEFPPALVQDLAAVDRARLQFVAALRDFAALQARPVGDEGVEIAALARLDRARQEWDLALSTMRTRAGQASRFADLEVALASRYLGRLAIDDALGHLDAAARDDNRRSDVNVARALALTRSNRPALALDALRSAQAGAPDDPTIHYLLAQHWSAENRESEAGQALRAFVRAASRKGRVGPARFERLEFFREVTGVAPIFAKAGYAPGFRLLVDGRLTEGVADLRRTASDRLAEDQSLVAAMTAAGLAIGRAALPEAIEQTLQAITRWPTSGELHRLLGLAYWLMGQQSEALASLRQARDLQPADERARIALAEVFIAAGRSAEAERELTAVLAVTPASGHARYRLAQLHLNAGDLPGAVTLLRDTMRLSPPIVGRDHVLSLLGSTLVRMADFDGAVAAYRQRVTVNPNSGIAHRQLAEVYFLQGRHDEALGEFTAALWLDAGDARAQAGVAQVFLRLERYADAAGSAQAALTIEPALSEARFALGTALMRLGRQDEGRAHLASFAAQRAEAQLKGQLEFELDALRREAARAVNAPADAITLLERALDLDPGNPRSQRELGLALLRAGDADRGRDHLERAQQIEATADVARRLADLYRRSNVPEASARHQAEYERLQEAERQARLKLVLGSWLE